MRQAASLRAPLGPDPAMWGLAAEGLRRGWLPEVLPVYPALTALGSALTGLEAWVVGGWVSLLAASLVPAAVAAVGRSLGLSWWTAAPVAATSLLLPDLLGFAWQLQPDSLATLGVLGVLAAGLRHCRQPSAASAALWLLAGLGLAMVREHGGVVLPAVAVALVALRWPRVGLVVLVAGAVAGTLLATGVLAEHLPERLAMPLRESPLAAGTGPLPSYADEIGGPAGAALAESWRHGDTLGVWLALLERLAVRSGENLALIGLGLGCWIGLRRWRQLVPALVALSPVAVLVVIWSHRRHTSVLLPVALLGIAVALQAIARQERWRQAVAGLVLLAGGAFLVRHDVDLVRGLAGAAEHGHERERLAGWMASQPGGWFLGGQHNEMNLHLRWYRHNPELPRPGDPMPVRWSGAAWRTQWVGPPGTMPPPFTQVHVEGSLAVFRLEPAPGADRPCADVEPRGEVLFTAEHLEGTAEPACWAEPHFGAPPAPSERPWEGQPFVPPEGR